MAHIQKIQILGKYQLYRLRLVILMKLLLGKKIELVIDVAGSGV